LTKKQRWYNKESIEFFSSTNDGGKIGYTIIKKYNTIINLYPALTFFTRITSK
jgi:hypothetical protein